MHLFILPNINQLQKMLCRLSLQEIIVCLIYIIAKMT
jgi:hypothetical protein